MRRWPQTVEVFLEWKMYCVGCPIAGFHTLEDACHAHGIERDVFLASLRAAAARKRPRR
jgi:hybrid cluster-associated redox disulfide protein